MKAYILVVHWSILWIPKVTWQYLFIHVSYLKYNRRQIFWIVNNSFISKTGCIFTNFILQLLFNIIDHSILLINIWCTVSLFFVCVENPNFPVTSSKFKKNLTWKLFISVVLETWSDFENYVNIQIENPGWRINHVFFTNQQ